MKIYKIPQGTKVTTRYFDGKIIHEEINTLREFIFEEHDIFNSNSEVTEFMNWGHVVVVKNKDLKCTKT